MTFWSITMVTLALAVFCCLSEHTVQEGPNHTDTENLQSILGEPIHDATNVQEVHGVKRTTTMHKICLKLRDLSKRSKHTKNSLVKHRCGVLSRRDERYDSQAKKVAEIIQNGHKSKATLKEQREQLVREVNKLAKLSGPLPALKIAIAG